MKVWNRQRMSELICLQYKIGKIRAFARRRIVSSDMIIIHPSAFEEEKAMQASYSGNGMTDAAMDAAEVNKSE